MTKIGGNNIFINDFHLSQKCQMCSIYNYNRFNSKINSIMMSG